MASNHPAQKRYPPELRHRAVQMVLELKRQDPSDHGTLVRVARQLGVGSESLRRWLAQAEVDEVEESYYRGMSQALAA